MWVLIVMSWVTYSNVGSGWSISSVPSFTSQQTCEAAAQAVKLKHEKTIETVCRPQ